MGAQRKWTSSKTFCLRQIKGTLGRDWISYSNHKLSQFNWVLMRREEKWGGKKKVGGGYSYWKGMGKFIFLQNKYRRVLMEYSSIKTTFIYSSLYYYLKKDKYGEYRLFLRCRGCCCCSCCRLVFRISRPFSPVMHLTEAWECPSAPYYHLDSTLNAVDRR